MSACLYYCFSISLLQRITVFPCIIAYLCDIQHNWQASLLKILFLFDMSSTVFLYIRHSNYYLSVIPVQLLGGYYCVSFSIS